MKQSASGILLALLCCTMLYPADHLRADSVTLSPDPNNPAQTITKGPYKVDPGETETLTVTIEETGDWKFKSSTASQPTSDHSEFIWAASGGAKNYTLSVVNTYWYEAETEVSVTAVWEENRPSGSGGGGGGGGSGTPPTTISATVSASATAGAGTFKIEADEGAIFSGDTTGIRALLEAANGAQKDAKANWTVGSPGRFSGSGTGEESAKTSVELDVPDPAIVTVEATCDDDPNMSDSVEIVALDVSLAEATFGGGNHPLKRDDGTYASDGTDNVRSPQIVAGAESTEICYTLSAKPVLNVVKMTIEPALGSHAVSALARIEGTQAGRSVALIYSKAVSLDGAEITENFTTSDALADVVDNTTFDLVWKLSLDGGASYKDIASTQNKLFATKGTPSGSVLTVTRISGMTTAAEGNKEMQAIVTALHHSYLETGLVGGHETEPPSPLWIILDRKWGQCVDWVDILRDHMLPLLCGTSYGTKYYLYAYTGGRAVESTSGDAYETRLSGAGYNGHTASHNHDQFNTSEKIMYSAAAVPNNYEATLKANGYYYSPRVPVRDSALNLLKSLQPKIDYLEWFTMYANKVAINQCVDPGPPTVPWP